MMTLQAMIAVLKAAEEGSPIQFRYLSQRGEGVWRDAARAPTWTFSTYEYRVKPKPIEVYIPILKGGGPGVYNYTSLAAAQTDLASHPEGRTGRIAKFIEVIE